MLTRLTTLHEPLNLRVCEQSCLYLLFQTMLMQVEVEVYASEGDHRLMTPLLTLVVMMSRTTREDHLEEQLLELEVCHIWDGAPNQ